MTINSAKLYLDCQYARSNHWLATSNTTAVFSSSTEQLLLLHINYILIVQQDYK